MSDKSIFRQESLDQVSSPDELDKYIHAVPVQMWMLLIAVTVFLFGALVWASVGYVSVTANVVVTEENGQFSFTLDQEQFEKLTDSSYLTINGQDYPVQNIQTASSDSLNISYLVTGSCEEAEDGVFLAELTFEKMHPMTFILN